MRKLLCREDGVQGAVRLVERLDYLTEFLARPVRCYFPKTRSRERRRPAIARTPNYGARRAQTRTDQGWDYPDRTPC